MFVFFFVVFPEKHFCKIIDKSCNWKQTVFTCIQTVFKSNSQLIYSICNNLSPNNQHNWFCKFYDNKVIRLNATALTHGYIDTYKWTVHGKTTDEWHTSTHEWHTDDIRVHTIDIRMTYLCIRVTYRWHTGTGK